MLYAEETAFASAAGNGLDVAQIAVSNSSSQPGTLELWLDGNQRNLPAFAAGSQLSTRDGVYHAQAHEPAEQHVVVNLLNQQPLGAHRVEHLQ